MKIKISFLPLILGLFLGGCARQAYKDTRFLLDTVCEITVIDTNKTRAQEALETAFEEIKRIDRLCGYEKDSQVSQISANAGKRPVKVDPELFKLIEESIRISELTGGAFDITVGPLVSLWGFDKHNPALPPAGKIKRVLPLVNYKNIRMDSKNSSVFLLKPGMKLDLGGIAKKYTMRTVMKKLQGMGIKKAMVNLGGDIQVRGGALGKNPWKIGLQHPRKTDQLVTIFKYNDKTIITSGDYERYFFHNGVRYHHIFNPHTGYPTKGIISATVLTDGPILADALATAVFVLGEKKGLALIEKIPDTDLILITESKKGTKIILSRGLKNAKLEFSY